MSDLRVAVDASRVRSGGGVAHLVGILDIDEPAIFGIKEIHVWAYQALLDALPAKPWLIKHHPPETEMNLLRQVVWQAFRLEREIQAAGCHILFTADASTFCRFKPMVVLSQNMLPYDDGMVKVFGLSKNRLQQNFIYQVQKRAFSFAQGVVFLTKHAATQIQKHTGRLADFKVINHGVNEVFKKTTPHTEWPAQSQRAIRCIYVSPIWEYKFQWVVVRAIKQLRDKGYNVNLAIVGGGGARAKKMLSQQIATSDPNGQFVTVDEFLPHNEIPHLIAQSDVFVFASGCETFGISLLEAMTIGVPIASSDRSSLPETLRDGGVYFDPENDDSIASAIEQLIIHPTLRVAKSQRAKALSAEYSWQRCADETWRYVAHTYDRYTGRAV